MELGHNMRYKYGRITREDYSTAFTVVRLLVRYEKSKTSRVACLKS